MKTSENKDRKMVENKSGGNRPLLKKIKRPIYRPEPISSSRPVASSSSISTTGLDGVSSNNINTYLDTPVMAGQNAANTKNFSGRPQAQYIDENAYAEEVYGISSQSVGLPDWFSTKILIIVACGCLLIGMLLGKILFGSSKVVSNGLQGVVMNSEVPRGRARCGVAERNQGCVLYLMNPQRQDLAAKDFYDLAAQMTGRQRFMIETGNMRYANTKIKPGEIVQLNIPPL